MIDEDRADAETGDREQAQVQAEEQEPESEAPEAEPAEEKPQWAPPPPEEMNVFDMLRAAIPLFVQEAWIALGVLARPGTSEVKTDLRAARIAIDTTQVLIEKLGDEATSEERREFEQILTNLRMNFVRRQSKAQEQGT
ncbi:MAG: DUF1844 domain-containing protein [Armatimonadota bacterium]